MLAPTIFQFISRYQLSRRCVSSDRHLRARKSSADGVIHPNVLIQFFPTQRQTVQAQLYFLQEFFGGFGKQGKFCNGKTDEPSVGQLQAHAPGIHPATRGDGFIFWFSDHALEYTLPTISRNSLLRVFQSGSVRPGQNQDWRQVKRVAARIWLRSHRARRECVAAHFLPGYKNETDTARCALRLA